MVLEAGAERGRTDIAREPMSLRRQRGGCSKQNMQ